MRLRTVIAQVVQATLILAVLAVAAWATFQQDPHDELRRADALFIAGRYHDALASYYALAARAPDAATARLRLGMVLVVRGEQPAASRELGWALRLGLNDVDAALARLYQGRMAADLGYDDEAARSWAQIAPESPYYGPRLALEAEERLRRGDYANAEAGFRAALAAGLPESWRATAHLRLAALRASSDAAGALAELEAVTQRPRGPRTPERPLTIPLRPAPQPDALQLAAALAADDLTRPQLLGQLYLSAGLIPLAEAQFASARAGPAASAYAAYTRWIEGDRAGGMALLRTLAVAAPTDPRPRTLLALAYLDARDLTAARTEIDAARRIAPTDPDALVALGRWYAVQREYTAAAAAYDQARRNAPPAERGAYALAQARYHLDTSLRLCDAGLPVALEAVALRPDDNAAWSTLSATRLACGDPAGAREAAERALAIHPDDPEAAYHQGRALALLGERSSARLALVRAADLAPASEWRARAEAQIIALGLR